MRSIDFKVHARELIAIPCTFAAFACSFDPLLQTAIVFVLWAVLLLPRSLKEWLALAFVNVTFVVMDILVQQKGFFHFTEPNLWGLPYWEFFAWGYFAIMCLRFFPSAHGVAWRALPPALLFAASFALLPSQQLLTYSTYAMLAVMVAVLGRQTAPVMLFAITYGLGIETVGVATGKWAYSEPNAILGIPLWGISMWAGTAVIITFVLNPILSLLLRKKHALHSPVANALA